MAQIYRPSQARKSKTTSPVKRDVNVSALDHQGRGVVRDSSGVRFVSGALSGEVIDFQPQGKWQGKLLQVKTPTSDRVIAACPHYNDCGGCDLQHLELTAQRQHKQQVVTELFAKFAGHKITSWEAPLTAEAWRYRRRLRLACHWDGKRRKFKLGLRQANSKSIVEIDDCLISDEALTRLLTPLRGLLSQLSLVKQLGHVELISSTVVSIVLRLQRWPDAVDLPQLQKFAQQYQVDFWIQCNESAPQPLDPQQQLPTYASWQTELAFQPGDFLQAHGDLSVLLVEQALAWLDPQPEDSILELYAGSGNFSLPIAKQGAKVTAIEGVQSMVERLNSSARQHDLEIVARQADLSADWQQYEWARTPFNKVFLDPARAGAAHAIEEVCVRQPQRVIYVSCAPDTLARDAQALFSAGYHLARAQIVDMFPQTHHIECLTWFEREA
ncbi:rRNA adenine N-6-methyltransferase family protein [Pseudidiomarina sp. E22-M8]|uniref:rRNA adenine N-6-methyltransferase family protein n=1 Tax=Pseudidiomarina sp. E22-M8 TaxID=3424768 RepID=UPI00403CE15C